MAYRVERISCCVHDGGLKERGSILRNPLNKDHLLIFIGLEGLAVGSTPCNFVWLNLHAKE